MKINQILLTAFAFSLAGCGGSSSNNAASTAPTTTPAPAPTTFEYDRIAATHTNKAWDSIMIGKFSNDQQEFVVDYAPSTTRAVVETTTSMQIDFTGTTIGESAAIDFSRTLTVADATVTNLFETGTTDSVLAQSTAQTFADANVKLITHDLDYLASQRLQYTDTAFVESDLIEGRNESLFAVAYGDATEAGDLPTTGTKTYDIAIETILDAWDDDDTGLAGERTVATGTASITINFATNAVSGTLVMERFYDEATWAVGGDDIPEVDNGFPFTATLVDMTMVDGKYSGELDIQEEIDGDGIFAGGGVIEGLLFGPDADETGIVFTAARDDEGGDTTDLIHWDAFGFGMGL